MVDEDEAPNYVTRPMKCWACAVRDRDLADAREAGRGQHMHGVYWPVIRNGS